MPIIRIIPSKPLVFILFFFLVFNSRSQSDSPPVRKLRTLYDANAEFRLTVDRMLDNVHDLPDGSPNPWKGRAVSDLYDFLNEWFYFLPDTHNGLDRIIRFSFLYYKNPHGMEFVLSEPGKGWTLDFVRERGKYMDSPESARVIADWLSDPALDNQDFELPEAGFTSFNDFFTRDLIPGARPIDDPADPSVLVSPADGIVNMIANNLELETEIPTKGRMTMRLNALLDHSPYAEKFVGGTAMAVFLMPDNYHHYHAPTTGVIVESKERVGSRLFGMPDILDMVNNGNPGYNKDYSVFEDFKHGYFIIRTRDYGYIAMIPIGLQTVGSVVFEAEFKNISGETPIRVYKGDKLGHFQYGGSTVLLLFEPGRLNAVSVEQGQRIGKLRQ